MVTVAHTVCVGTFGVARDSDERCFDSGVCRHSVLSYAIQVAGLAFTGVICRWPSRLTVECLREVPNTAEYVIPAVHYLIMSLPLVYMLYNPPVRQFVLWLISQSDSPWAAPTRPSYVSVNPKSDILIWNVVLVVWCDRPFVRRKGTEMGSETYEAGQPDLKVKELLAVASWTRKQRRLFRCCVFTQCPGILN